MAVYVGPHFMERRVKRCHARLAHVAASSIKARRSPAGLEASSENLEFELCRTVSALGRIRKLRAYQLKELQLLMDDVSNRFEVELAVAASKSNLRDLHRRRRELGSEWVGVRSAARLASKN
jgi:hypothetical protein